jgi:hypothetical protein
MLGIGRIHTKVCRRDVEFVLSKLCFSRQLGARLNDWWGRYSQAMFPAPVAGRRIAWPLSPCTTRVRPVASNIKGIHGVERRHALIEEQTIQVTKIDAAMRQLDCAIELWFRDGDAVSIHALTAAAYDVIATLNAKGGNPTLTMTEQAKRYLPPESVKSAVKAMREPMVFFKHADKGDPDETLDFDPSDTTMLMALSMAGLEPLGVDLSVIQRALSGWHSLHEPQFIKPELNYFRDASPEELTAARKVSKGDFLELSLQAHRMAQTSPNANA